MENSDALVFIRIGYGNQLHIIDMNRASSTLCGRYYPYGAPTYTSEWASDALLYRYFDGICATCQKGSHK